MKSDSRKFFMFAGLLAVVFAVFAGCAHTVPVAPHPPLQAGGEKIPLDVGLYLSEELRNYQVSEYKMGDQWNYTNLGAASASQFKLGLNQRFLSVELLDRLPPFPGEKKITIRAVIEPIIDNFDFDIPFTKFQVYPARIRYLIRVYDIEGNIILKDIVEGVGDIQGQPGFDFSENPSKSASKAIEDGVQKSVEEIAKSDKIRHLYEYAKISDPHPYKGESVLKPSNPVQSSQPTSLKSVLETEKKRLADEAAQVERLRYELEQLKTQIAQEEKTETPKVASIPNEVQAAKLLLRKESKILLRRDLNKMLLKYHFFDVERNPTGNFENDFIANPDGTITDRITGLMWQKSGSAHNILWLQATRYIQKLNRERFAGYSDWRLPTVEELASLMMRTKERGLYLSSLFDRTQKKCWSADSLPRPRPGSAVYEDWIISFSNGSITYARHLRKIASNWYAKDEFNYVRAVRSVK